MKRLVSTSGFGRRGMTLGVALAVTAAGCAASGKKMEPRVRLLTHAEVAPEDPFIAVPFGEDADGTEMVIELMREAFAMGADRVADLTLHFAVDWGDRRLRCESKTVAERALPGRAGSANPPGPLHRVTRFVRERAYACEVDVEQVIRTRKRRLPKAEYATVSVRPGCGYRAVERYVSRYAFEFDIGFVPPDWDRLSGIVADQPLAQGAVTCWDRAASDTRGNFASLRVVRLRKQVAVQPLTYKPAEVWRYRKHR